MIDKIKKHIKKEFGFLNEETQNRLVNTAMLSFKETKEDLKEILNSDDKDEILKIVHKFKGLLLNFGLSALANEFNDTKLKEYSLEEIKKRLQESLQKI